MGRGKPVGRTLALAASKTEVLSLPDDWCVSEYSNLPNWVAFRSSSDSLLVITVRALQGTAVLLINEEVYESEAKRYALNRHCLFDPGGKGCLCSNDELHAALTVVAASLGVCSTETLEIKDVEISVKAPNNLYFNFSKSLTYINIFGTQDGLLLTLLASSLINQPVQDERAFFVNDSVVKVRPSDTGAKAYRCKSCASADCVHMKLLASFESYEPKMYADLMASYSK